MTREALSANCSGPTVHARMAVCPPSHDRTEPRSADGVPVVARGVSDKPAEAAAPEAVRLSIIICTRNRAELLRLCLDALGRQQGVPPDVYEVLVVDNGSSDRTRQVVDAARLQFHRIRYVYEERLGLSIARNVGVSRTAGAIVCFLDDDAIASPDFVRELLPSFEDPRAACVAGKIVASWPDGAPPAWFTPRYGHVVAQTSFGETTRWMKGNEYPFGANMSFRREVFQRLGGFDENLGKRGENNIWGEEMDLCRKLRENGFGLLYSARAQVNHVIGRGRATKRYFIDSVFGKGVTMGHLRFTHDGKTAFAFYLFVRLLRLTGASLCCFLAGGLMSEPARFRLRCTIASCTGYLHFLAVRDDLGSVPADAEV